jgi:hypothetical protein
LHQRCDIDPVSVHAANQGDLWVEDQALEDWYTCRGHRLQNQSPVVNCTTEDTLHTKKDPRLDRRTICLVEVRTKGRVGKESLEVIRGRNS